MAAPVALVGYGAFGPVHLRAWQELGFGGSLYVADPSPAARLRAPLAGLPEDRVVADLRAVIDRVDIVDIVTPLPTHAPLAELALKAGKHVFLEKPATATVEEAVRLRRLGADAARVLQVGYYLRAHPLAARAKRLIDDGALGPLRFLAGDFYGYKRTRTDSGALANDAVHVLDLANWLVGALPVEVYAETRDHLGRGVEDLAIVLLTYGDGALARIEAGTTWPGAHADAVVPGALTTKRFTAAGGDGALEIDIDRNTLTHHRVRHVLRAGAWHPEYGECTIEHGAPADPVSVLRRQFEAFLDSIATGAPLLAGIEESGVGMARLLDAARAAAAQRRAVRPTP